MLDALSLANSIYTCCCCHDVEKNNNKNRKKIQKKGLAYALQSFEKEMLLRSSVKVQALAEAVKFLHSPIAIQKGNVTRGGCAAAVAAATNNNHNNDVDIICAQEEK